MDYKQKLKKLMDDGLWERLLSESLLLHQEGNEDRYVIQMIIHACEELGREKEVIPFWEMLAREEHHSEEFTRKLIDHYKQVDEKDAWLLWSRRLLSRALRKRDYTTVEDIWMQLVDAKKLERELALDMTERLVAQEEHDRAYTMLDILLLSLQDNPVEALIIAKRMIALAPENLDLRKRIEGFYRKRYGRCEAVEQFLENANIRKSDDVAQAIDYFEHLVLLCPGNYVSHKSWGVGKIRSIDLLFGKIFIDFPASPNHSIDVNRALSILEPLDEGNFEVMKIEDPLALKKLKQTQPAELIKLMLRESQSLSQKRVQTLLEGILDEGEWPSFLDRVKKGSKASGLKLTRKGTTYLFSVAEDKEDAALTLAALASIKGSNERMKGLIRFTEEGISSQDVQEWTELADALVLNHELGVKDRMALLMKQRDLTGDRERFENGIDTLFRDLKTEEKAALVEELKKKKNRKQLLEYVGSHDAAFAEAVFLRTADDWLRVQALAILALERDTGDLISRVLGNPQKYPLCFLYLTETAMKQSEQPQGIEKPIIVFETILEFMVHDDVEQKVRTRAKSIFKKFGFDLYRWMLETSSKEELSVLLDMVRKHPLIETSEKITFEKLAESRYPALKEKPKEVFFYATKQAIQQKQKELDHLVKVEIPANSAEIGKAARQGDLSENFDYIAAKEKQRKLIDRTGMLKRELSQVHPIEEVAFEPGTAGIGTHITAKSKETGREQGITILGPWDAVPEKHIISHTAPLAQEIIGKKVGETFFDPFLSEHLEILEVSRYDPEVLP